MLLETRESHRVLMAFGVVGPDTDMSTQRSTDGTLRIVLVVLAVVILAPILLMVAAVPMMGMWGGGMMGGYGGYGGYGASPLWGVGMLLLWLVLLVGGGYLVYRWLVRDGVVGTDRALEELRMAYARGDISDEEFEERRARLGEE